MTDKELLEAAARAAGYSIHTWLGDIYHTDFGRGVIWNPLKDDGDAFRLMADLGIDVDHHDYYVDTYCGKSCHGEEYCNYSSKSECVRRAIVLAAAEMVKK